MKKIIYLILVLVLTASCTENMKDIQIPDPITPDQITVNLTATATQNVYDVVVTVPEGIVKVDLGNGSKIQGNTGKASYPFKGDYSILVGVATKGGVTNKTLILKVVSDNYELLNDPIYTLLAGAITATDGKTWVLDSLSKGHMGCGPDNSLIPEWWTAPPMDKKGKMIYDDEITFKLKGAKVILDNKGKTYLNGAGKAAMALRGASPIEAEVNYGAAGGDFVATYTTGTNWTWAITKDSDKNYINFPASQAFFMYFVGESDKYQIISLTENEMTIRVQLPGIAWYFKLIKKGFVR